MTVTLGAVADRLGLVYAADWGEDVAPLLFLPRAKPPSRSIEEALRLIANHSSYDLPKRLLPLAVVDESSIAVVALPGNDVGLIEGTVARWHLGDVLPKHQLSPLDIDAALYISSLSEELQARQEGLRRILDEIGPAYQEVYLEQEKRPRDFVVRPVRIACQNVIVALAAFAHDSSIDGLSVLAWQTCEVPHVAANEANRALTALMLCDAFQSGGTMEIRFDRPAHIVADGVTAKSGRTVKVDVNYQGHPELRVPTSLRRFARTLDISLGLGDEDQARITPEQARELFLKITPMPDGLVQRVKDAVAQGVATPERLCFTLLSQIWREIELDFMLAVSPRVASILSGGAPSWRRAERQAESEVARAALMTGMLYRRLDSRDGAGAEGVETRVLEDNRAGVSWEVLPEVGAVRFSGTRAEPLPWQDKSEGGFDQHLLAEGGVLVVLPRLGLDPEVLAVAADLGHSGPVAVVLPRDGDGDASSAAEAGCLLLRCPDRLGELDQVIEGKLLSARIARA
jgi:hypothetical protein